MFKVNNKGVFIVNFEQISHFFSVSIVDFKHVFVCLLRRTQDATDTHTYYTKDYSYFLK